MESDVQRLVKKVEEKTKTLGATQRYLIGISGIPGSGKTTLGKLVTTRLAASLSGSSAAPAAVFVGMDGFHLTRAQLDAMTDPAEAHRRRGAAFTFDAAGFVELVRRVRQAPYVPAQDDEGNNSGKATATPIPGTAAAPILAPSFDHAVKDPVADDVAIPACARIVVFEGNYLALDSMPWRQAGELMDEIWFVDVEEDVARRRLAARHVEAGIVESYEDGLKRADDNDLPNGREIIAGKWKVDETINSKEDGSWAGN